MSDINTSGSQERFHLAAGETKRFLTEDFDGPQNGVYVETHVDSQEKSDAQSDIRVEESADGASWSQVGAAQVVVAGGRTQEVFPLTEPHVRFRNLGDALAYMVAKPLARIQTGDAL